MAQRERIQDPVRNFEKLWTTFDRLYANFERKEVDWSEVYRTYRPMVNAQTTNKELSDISCAMVQELRDGHVMIDPSFEDERIECGPPYTFAIDEAFPSRAEWRQFEAVMDTTLLRQGFSPAVRTAITEETNFQYRLSEDLGYLRLDEMTERLTFGKFTRALDEAVSAFQPKAGIIIDLRFNGGGWDYIAYQLASRFTSPGTELGHYERQRREDKSTYSKRKYRRVKAKGRHQYTKPVVLLVSDFTASAAEVFVLLLKDLPHVTIIGDTTEGIFSDMHEFKLPNSWEVTLSRQQFFSREMINYEGIGIAPDVRALNGAQDLVTGRDAVLEAGVAAILSK